MGRRPRASVAGERTVEPPDGPRVGDGTAPAAESGAPSRRGHTATAAGRAKPEAPAAETPTDGGGDGLDGGGLDDEGLDTAGLDDEADEIVATGPAPAGGRIEIRVEREAAVERLDAGLARRLAPDGPSRSRIKALVADGRITVEGVIADDPSRKLPPGALVAIDLPAPVAATPAPEAIPLAIVYEDDDVIVIDKPAGLVVHPGAGHHSGTLVNALLAHCGTSLSGIGGVSRPGIVHRLDRETSGLMVAAKTDPAHRALSAQFADHGRTGPLERAYLAVVWGGLTSASGTVDLPIGRDPRRREAMAVVGGGQGRAAVTHYQVLARYGEAPGGPLASLVECRLETGRTHQIRVHMAHLGHPLLGDPVYGTGFRTKADKLARRAPAAAAALAALDRQALHARLLAFAHPRKRRTLRFESPPPPDLAQLIAALGALDDAG